MQITLSVVGVVILWWILLHNIKQSEETQMQICTNPNIDV